MKILKYSISEPLTSSQCEQLQKPPISSTFPSSQQITKIYTNSSGFVPSRIKNSLRSQSVLSYNVGSGITITSTAEPTAPLPRTSKRRTTMSCVPDAEQTSNNIKIKLLNAQPDMGVVKVVLNFHKEGPDWYTKLYRSHEGDFWQRVPREPPKKYGKWLYHCNVCGNYLCSFNTIKAHLNTHYGFFPYSCIECSKKYPSMKSLHKHRKSYH